MSAETWFVGDSHFGHTNILNYEKEFRPFDSVEQMNEVMVQRWNAVVKKQDIVWHLGDFAFGREHLEIAKRLNGIKRLILGNHDQYPEDAYLTYFNSLHGAVYWREKKFILTHVPVHPCNLAGKNCRNIHGHLHSKFVMIYKNDTKVWERDSRYINVSVEQNNLTPINAQEILNGSR